MHSSPSLSGHSSPRRRAVLLRSPRRRTVSGRFSEGFAMSSSQRSFRRQFGPAATMRFGNSLVTFFRSVRDSVSKPHLSARRTTSFLSRTAGLFFCVIHRQAFIGRRRDGMTKSLSRPNHAMERTADRLRSTFEMTSTLPPQATCSLVRRRSSCSR
jgi:hypothetical protein